MAAEAQQGPISAAFPAPPPFYKFFTSENLERLQQQIEPSSQTSTDTLPSTELPIPSIADLTSLPTELRNLIPPNPPTDGKYRSFGALHDINPSPPTPQEIPTREILLNLTKRLMHLFHRYVQILATNPSGELWVPQWEEIKNTFEEVHRVINEYRPHEARESLILRYEDQIRQVKEETERVRVSVERARRVLEELAVEGLGEGEAALVDGQTNGLKKEGRKIKTKNEKVFGREQLVWSVIEREVGGA